jgi:dephospho-CoA kinase
VRIADDATLRLGVVNTVFHRDGELWGTSTDGEGFLANLSAHVPSWQAQDRTVVVLGAGGAAVMPVAAVFSDVVVDGRIDRSKLARHLAAHPDDFVRLEEIVHPLVRAEQERFLVEARSQKAQLAVLDIPLLFETGRDRDVDKIVVVSAPADTQRRRVLARPGMTEQKFAAILARQLTDSEKRARADFIVDSDRGLDYAHAQVRHIINVLSRGDSS